MLLLNASPQVWIDHEETKCRFLVRPIDPRDNRAIHKKAKDKKGDFDPITYNGLVVDHAVIEWEGVGDASGLLPACPENKRKLGEKFPGISGFIYAKATDVALFLDEVKEAKND